MNRNSIQYSYQALKKKSGRAEFADIRIKSVIYMCFNNKM